MATYSDLIEKRLFVYTGYVVCIYNAKYIEPTINHGLFRFVLSEYGRDHADECCIKFCFQYGTATTAHVPLYCNKFFCKLKDNDYSHLQDEKTVLTPAAINDMNSYYIMHKEKEDAERILSDMKAKKIDTFQQAFNYHLERQEKRYTDIADEEYLKSDTLKKYYQGKRKPKLEPVMLICNGLNLQYDLAIDLLKRANIALNLNNKKDLIYDYLLTITNASIEGWNLILEEQGFPTFEKSQSLG